MNTSIVYIIEEQTGISNELIKSIMPYIPLERREKANRYRRIIDRNNCILSYFLLMYGLLKHYDMIKIPMISIGKYGKPYFPEKDIHFNISHSDIGICCGIAKCNIGVDIQDIKIKYQGILDMVMSNQEKQIILKSKFPTHEFARFWTLKESICKYRGTGINDDLKNIDFSKSGDSFVYDGLFFRSEKNNKYCVSACAKDNIPIFVKQSPEQYIYEFLYMMH